MPLAAHLTLITHLIVAAVSATAVWVFQDARWDADVSAIRQQAADAALQASNKARANEQAIAKTYQEALNEARTREAHLRRDRDHARTESDGLRTQLTDTARRLAAAPPAAVLEYATTTNELFADCSRRYQELAGHADGHAADVRTLTEAWPNLSSSDGKR